MAKPIIMTVDDDPEVLAALGRDLRRQYGAEYRIVAAGSGREAIDAAVQFKGRGIPVALFLVDQRMPLMTGTQTLCELRKLYPDACKVLLTAYADTDAAIAAINEVGLDHYLMKPWHPPAQRLFPVLDELLSAWAMRVRLPYDGIRIAGSRWSPQSYTVREFLSLSQVPYQWLDIDQDVSARELVTAVAGDTSHLPVVLFPDGVHLVMPTNLQLAERVGLQTRAKLPFYDIVVVGGGPAGLANGLYAASEGLRTLLVEQGAPGGQAGTSSLIENYLGFPSGITGADLARRAAAQARRFGAELVTAQEVISLRREDPYRILRFASGAEVSCYAAVITTGMSVRRLDVPGIDSLLGIGVYYGAAMSEAALYRGQDVCIVGGANSAGQGALFFSRYARKVTMLVRGTGLSSSMSQYLVDRIKAVDNIEVLTGVEVSSVGGQGRLEHVCLRDTQSDDIRPLNAAAMFIFIGVAPRSEPFAGVLERDERGFILTGLDLPRPPRGWTLERDPLMFETSMPGVFAAGDVRAGANRRVAAAVGEGSAAIHSVQQYLRTV